MPDRATLRRKLRLSANVWLALLWSRHIHSEKAREWLGGSPDEKFVFCRFTQLTILRLLTSAVVMGSDVREMPEAWELWDEVCADDRVAYLPEPEAIEPEFRRPSQLSSSWPKVWADSYLLAFATVAGLKLVTFDRVLRSRGCEVLIL
jgi:toxin-antitoxin system PIN domain toxin